MNITNHLKIITVLFSALFIFNVNAKTLKIATLAPGGSNWMKIMKQGAQEVAEKTNNRVNLKFYPGGVMGDDGDVLKKMRIGQLHGGAMTSGAVTKYFPDSQIYSIPLAFKSFDEVDYVRKHMDQKIIDGLEKGGIVTLGLSEGGLAFAMSNEPIETTSDLLNRKIWTPSGNTNALSVLEAFDVTPIPLNIADVLTGLQSNMIDTIATPPVGAIALQWHTQIKYITEIPLLYIYAVLAVDKKSFFKLQKQDQEIVREVMSEAFNKIGEQNRKDNIAAMSALKNQGIKFLTPKINDLNEWYSKADKATDQIKSSGSISREFISELKKHLKNYRAQQNNLSENKIH